MSTPSHFPVLSPVRIQSHLAPDYQELLQWVFAPNVFYVEQISTLLQEDLIQHFTNDSDSFKMWRYLGCLENKPVEPLGFGSYLISDLYSPYCLDGKHRHGYIPVLSGHPGNSQRNIKGVGKQIVEHLKQEATLSCNRDNTLSKLLFLDVYVENEVAINLYLKYGGFEILNPDNPLHDEKMDHKPYYVMGALLD